MHHDRDQKKKQGVNMLWILSVVLLLLLIFSARDAVTTEVAETGQARLFSTLRYCSDSSDLQCAANTASLNIRTFSRNSTISERYGNEPVDRLNVVLDEVEIELATRADERFPENVWLVEDTNESGGIDSEDQRIAQGVVKKKRILFEDVNYALVQERVGPEGYNASKQFFVSSYDEPWDVSDFLFTSEEGEPASTRLIEEIRTRAIDITENNRTLQDSSVFADLSLYQYREAQTQTIDEFVAGSPMFKKISSSELVVEAGDYEVKKDLVIPAGLRITVQPGVDIKIAPEVSILSYSPIDFLGTANNPISIDKLEETPFSSVVIIGRSGSPEDIRLNYLNIAGGDDDHINGIVATGMMSIFRFNTVTVTNSSFTGSTSDDGLNIKNSAIVMENNVFDSNSADAFDGDFVNGPITNNYFIDNGNDSLDFSGSDVVITENRIIDSGDKCISVGEGTDLLAEKNILSGCNIGSEVKDRSNGVLRDNLISGSKSFGLNAYVKKFFFGEPKPVYQNNYFAENTEDFGGLIVPDRENNQFFETTNDAIKEIPWYQRVLKATSLQ